MHMLSRSLNDNKELSRKWADRAAIGSSALSGILANSIVNILPPLATQLLFKLRKIVSDVPVVLQSQGSRLLKGETFPPCIDILEHIVNGFPSVKVPDISKNAHDPQSVNFICVVKNL